MPRIKEYISSGKLTPDDQGYSAYETAGRRIGPLLNQAAQDIRQQGAGVADLFDQNKFGITAFLDTPQGVNFRTKGGSSGASGGRSGGGGGHNPRAAQEISSGGRALTGLAQQVVNPAGSGTFVGDYGKNGIKPISATPFSESQMFDPNSMVPTYPAPDVNDIMSGIGSGALPPGTNPPDEIMRGNMQQQDQANAPSVWDSITSMFSGNSSPTPAADTGGDDTNPMN